MSLIAEPKGVKRVMDTQCPFCSVQCKMQVIEEVAAAGSVPSYSVVPKPNQASEGRLCIKGMNAYQHALTAERILHPMMKIDGKFVQVTWADAYAHIVRNFHNLRDQYGQHSVGVYGGGSLTNESAYLLGKFARVALQTKYIDYNGRFCMSAAASAGVKVFGIDRGLTNQLSDIEMAECLLLAGTNIAECQPTLMPYLTRAKEKGAFLIAIDPRETGTTRIADLHLRVKPGMDATLANGMLKVLLEEGLVDQHFVDHRTNGFSELKTHLESLDMKEISELAGVPETLIRQAALAYGRAATGMVFTARGVEQQTDGHMAVRNFLNLVLLTGKIGKPGCGYGAVTGQGNGQGGREHGQKADQLPGYRLIENPEDRAYVAGVWGIDPNELPGKGVSAYEMMELVHQQEIRALFVMGSNPIVSNPNANFVEEGLKKLDFLVVADFLLSETAQLADLILPASTYLENGGTLTNLEGRVLLRESAQPVPGEVKHDWQILCELAGSLGRGSLFQYQDAEDIFDELRLASRGGVADYYGITYERLRQEEGIYWPCPEPQHPGQRRLFEASFPLPDGKALLTSVANHLPQERISDAFPLYLTTGRVLTHYLTGVQTRRSHSLAARDVESFMEIHPKTARKYRLEDAALVKVASKRGEIYVRCRYSSDIREDTVFVPMHWGNTQNVNKITNDALDPTCRMPGFKVCAVHVSPFVAE
ncbi:molybdopterin oxidoreductase family protein [Paenibacillus sp. GCM10023248]|uniref:assimilatory nitrate reductase catalytic subunit NasC n=1 Tax=Bacillales TaxID=1385 RepID=UPI0023786113|nr:MULTISPECIES: molybdopterin oxidoreductase family protein [Bacillales]MDD9270448.1 molybdopterin oxidoreductase family protein [Paenibacillus sp. MAHUQ-63]MDR6884185.1 assimilatory nitrate reductase catalytic subunit [Bacillus sp. 3255]